MELYKVAIFYSCKYCTFITKSLSPTFKHVLWVHYLDKMTDENGKSGEAIFRESNN